MSWHRCLSLLVLLAAPLAQALEFQVTELGPAKADALTVPLSLNNKGDVVGQTITNFHTYRPKAALLRGGHTVDLMKRAGLKTLSASAVQITARGVIAGTVLLKHGLYPQPFVDDHGQVTVLTPPERGYGYATGINNSGVVIGVSWTAEGDCLCGFRHVDGVWTALRSPVPTQRSEALAINDQGWVVGWANHRVGKHALRRATGWRDGQSHPLPDLGGRFSEAHGLNRQGDVVGVSDLATPRIRHAYLVRQGQAVDLDGDATSNSQAAAINDAEQIVGMRTVATRSGAFFYQDGQMHWLDDLLSPDTPQGVSIQTASSINQGGQIVGLALLPGSPILRAVLLTPVGP